MIDVVNTEMDRLYLNMNMLKFIEMESLKNQISATTNKMKKKLKHIKKRDYYLSRVSGIHTVLKWMWIRLRDFCGDKEGYWDQ